MAKMVFCNKCGRRFGKIDNLNGFHYAGKLGYGSCHDGSEFEIDLCMECIDEFIESCDLDPVVTEYPGNN